MGKKLSAHAVDVALIVLFLCILASGADRLIARQQKEDVDRVSTGAFTDGVILCPLSLLGDRANHAEPFTERRILNAETAYVHETDSVLLKTKDISRDANGNVLSCRNYMSAVYQAFAPEGGFG